MTMKTPSRSRELLERLDRVGGDQRDVAVAGEQPLDLLEPDVTAAHDQAAPPAEPQAGDVEGRVEHALDARLVADPLAELADAFLAGVGLGGHAFSLCSDRGVPPPSGR
jgi:hypothetical protein